MDALQPMPWDAEVKGAKWPGSSTHEPCGPCVSQSTVTASGWMVLSGRQGPGDVVRVMDRVWKDLHGGFRFCTCMHDCTG